MALENPKKEFKFLNPITQSGTATGIVHNFPLGAGDLDFTNLKKNIPHFEELAVSFGLGKAKQYILQNTLDLAKSKTSVQRPRPQFPSEGEFDDGPLPPVSINNPASLGFPIYSDLSIRAGSYKDNDGIEIGRYDEIHLPAVLFEVVRDNNIIVTEIQGRDNSVIEYLSGKSAKINCRGRVMSGRVRNTYPRTAVDNLIVALNSNVPLRVDSWFLNMFKIYHIVITKKSFPQEEGGMEYQKFEFDAIADYPVVLRPSK
jgi:hypothetical protein